MMMMIIINIIFHNIIIIIIIHIIMTGLPSDCSVLSKCLSTFLLLCYKMTKWKFTLMEASIEPVAMSRPKRK